MLLRRRLSARVGYQPHPKQQAVHAAIDRGAKRLACCWGRRGGKSEMAAIEYLTELCFPPAGHLPRRILPLVAPEADITDKIFRYLWRWCVQERVLGCEPVAKSERERYIEMPWGARIEGKNTSEPDSLCGDATTFYVSDEHAKSKNGKLLIAKYLLPPLLDLDGILLLLTTPEGTANHFHDTFQDWAELAESDPRYFVSHATSYDNPYLPEGEIARMEDEYRRAGLHDVFRQEYLAEFTSLTGAVYPNFQPTRNGLPWHVQEIEPFPEIKLSLGIDWGFRNPFVCLFAQVTPDDRLFIFDELYLTGRTDAECAGEVLDRGELLGVPFTMGYADPSSPEAIKTFIGRNIPMFIPPKGAKLNDVMDGILRVRGLLGRPDCPGVVVHPRCKQLISDLQNYVFNERAEGEKPVKVNDHGPDALRYLASGAIAQGLREIVWV